MMFERLESRQMLAAAGDFNGDGVVDAADLAEWTSDFGTDHTGFDLLAWQREFSAAPPPKHEHGENHGQVVHEANVEDLAANPTITAIASGDWSNPAIWSTGALPTADDVAVIPETISLTLAGDVGVGTLLVNGSLTFPGGELTVTTLIVGAAGTLVMHPSDDQVAQVTIRDAEIDTAIDPEQLGHGVIVQGRIDVLGRETTPFVRLSAEAIKGTTTLQLSAPVHWRVGDTVVLADSRQIGEGEHGYQWMPVDPRYPYQTPNHLEHETVAIAAVSADGLTITLAAPLEFSHLGARDVDGALQYLPHVGNLSRNVRFVSENPSGVRGHAMFLHEAAVDLYHAEFKDFGRTTIHKLNNATFNADGSTAALGLNQTGRYAIHLHRLDSTAAPLANGKQFNVVGNAVNGAPKWGIAVHDSHYGLIQGNVVYDAQGAAIVTESGNETGNVFDANFAVKATGSGQGVDARDTKGDVDNGHEGSLFWFRGTNQSVITNNVAVGGQVAGFMLYQFLSSLSMPKVRIPLFQGADLNNPAEYVETIDVSARGPALFADNEAYANFGAGFEIWSPVELGGMTVVRPTAWHNSHIGVFSLYNASLNLVNPVVLFQPGKHLSFTNTVGIFREGVGFAYDLHVTGGKIHGADEGVILSSQRAAQITGTELANATNIVVQYYGDDTVGARTIEIIDPVFRGGAVNVEMRWTGTFTPTFLAKQTTILRQNGQWRYLYYLEQAADDIVPETTPGIVGSPESGLTNQEAWVRYGVATAGAVAPETSGREDGILGLVDHVIEKLPRWRRRG